jgi:hypothetical protein
VSYSVSVNTSYEPRAGTIVIGGRLFRIVQEALPPPTCAVQLWPASVTWAADGGTAAFGVSSTANCDYTALTGASWIHIATTSAQGNAAIAYAVDANPSATTRSADIAVGGYPSTVLFTVTQQAAGTVGGNLTSGGSAQCSYAVSPFYVLVGSGGASQTMSISAPAQCSASFSSLPSWISLSAAQGSGEWSATLTVADNPGTESRVATLQIGGRAVTVEQNGVGGDAPLLDLSSSLSVADAPYAVVQVYATAPPATLPGYEETITVIGTAPNVPMIWYYTNLFRWIEGISCPSMIRVGRYSPIVACRAGVSDDTIDDSQLIVDRCVGTPPGVDLAANAAAAHAILEATLPPEDGLAYVTSWFVERVRPHGVWDYKESFGPGYRTLGNYNFGYVGSALGYSREALHNAAGLLQMTQAAWDALVNGQAAPRWNPSMGLPFLGPAPYGDSEDDYKNVEYGVNDFLNHRLSTCR